MIIRGAKVFTEKMIFEEKDILTEGERIAEVSSCVWDEGENIDATGMLVIPGLVDIHFHGAMGADFSDASEEALMIIAEYEARHGILSICPATMTLPEEELVKIMRSVREYSCESGAELVGINLEGPFISEKKPGAQKKDHICPTDVKLFQRLQTECGGMIKIVDVAPEKEGTMEFIEAVKEECVVSIAHSDCDYDSALLAFNKGATHMTHLFNAMNGISHRAPGPIIAALEHNAEVELISDGVHIHPAMVRFVFNCFDDKKIILISDSMRATGLPDGEYDLGGQNVSVKGNMATLSSSPDTIAGSVTNLYDCMKNAISFGVPCEKAIAAASINPAVSIGIDGDYGTIAPGKYANLLIVDPSFNIQTTLIRGKIIGKNEDPKL